MSLCVFRPLFYFVLLVFCSATYDVNDITINYPYCLTASKERKPSLTKEKSEKSYPLTYLEVLGSSPYGNPDSRLQKILSANNRKDVDRKLNNAKNRLDLMNNANIEHVRLKKSANQPTIESGISEGPHKDNSHVHISRSENEVVKRNDALTHDNLLESNDIPLPLTGKARMLTDHFIGIDEKPVHRVNNDGSLNPETAKPKKDSSNINNPENSDEELLVERDKKRRIHPYHNALRGDQIYRVYQDMTDLSDGAKSGRVSVDHNVCVEHQKGRKKKRIIEREKRMLGRKKKSRKQTKKDYQKTEKKTKKKNKKILKKLLKSKKKQSGNHERGIPGVTSNNRTRRGVPSKRLLEMISVPLGNYLQDVASKEDETKFGSREIKYKKNKVDLTKENDGQLCDFFTQTKLDPPGNKNLVLADKLMASTSNFVKCKSNTKQIGNQELKNIHEKENIQTINIFPTNDIMKIFNDNLNDMSTNLMGKIPENEPKTNYHFEISDIGLKPKEHNSVVYYLNRNVAFPSAHKLDALYGTKNSTKKLDMLSYTLDNAKEECDDIKMNEYGGMNNSNTGTGSSILTCENLTEQNSNKNTNATDCEAEDTKTLGQNGMTTPDCSDTVVTTNSGHQHQTVCTDPILNFPKTTTMCFTLPTTKWTGFSTIKTSPSLSTLSSESKQNLSSKNTTICLNKMIFDKCLAEANTNNTLAKPAHNTDCDSFSSVSNVESSLKAKRETIPINLLPALLKNDIEQPIQDGQSKKIFLYLHQVNPKDFTVGASDKDSHLVGLLKSNPNIEIISKDVNSVRRLLSPNLDFKFPRRKDYPSKDASELIENKLKKSKEKCECARNSAITIKTSGSTYKSLNNPEPTCACVNTNDHQFTMSPKTLIPNNFFLPMKSANCSQTKVPTSLRKLSLRTSLVDKTTLTSSTSKSIGSGLYLYNPMYRYGLSAVKNISLRNIAASSPTTTCFPTTQCQVCSLTTLTTTKEPSYPTSTKCPTCALTTQFSTTCPTCPTSDNPSSTKSPTFHTSPGQTKLELTTTCPTTIRNDIILTCSLASHKLSSSSTPGNTFNSKIECMTKNVNPSKSSTTCASNDTTRKSTTTCLPGHEPTQQRKSTQTTPSTKPDKMNTDCTTIRKDKDSKSGTDKMNTDCTTTMKDKDTKSSTNKMNTDCTTTRKNKDSKSGTDKINIDCTTAMKDKDTKSSTDKMNTECTTTREGKDSKSNTNKINTDCTTTKRNKDSKSGADKINADCTTTMKDKDTKSSTNKINTDCTTTRKNKDSKSGADKISTDCTSTMKDKDTKSSKDKMNTDCTTTREGKDSKSNTNKINTDCTTTRKNKDSKSGADKMSTNCTSTMKDRDTKSSTNKMNTDCTTTRINKDSKSGTDKMNTDCTTTTKNKDSKSSTNKMSTECTTTMKDKDTKSSTNKMNTDCTTTRKNKDSNSGTDKMNTDCTTTTKNKDSKSGTDKMSTECTTTMKDKDTKSSTNKMNTDCTTTRKNKDSKSGTDKINTDCTTTREGKDSKSNTNKMNTDCTTTGKDKDTKSRTDVTQGHKSNTTIKNDTTRSTTDKCIEVILTTYKSATSQTECIQGSWEPGENDARCRDDTELIEYWKEIL